MSKAFFERKHWKDRDIVVGKARVLFDFEGKVWRLIGGGVTNSESTALDNAREMNAIMEGKS